MGFTLTKKASDPIVMFMRNNRGKVVEQELDWKTLATPRAQPATLMVVGMTKPFEAKDSFNGGTKAKVRMLFEVVEGVSRPRDVGKRFTESMTASLAAKAKIGQIWTATMPPLEDGADADPTDMIGKSFQAMLSVNETADDQGNPRFWTNLVDKTIKPVSATTDEEDDEEDEAPPLAPRRTSGRREVEEEPPFDRRPASKPASADDDDDPFADEDDDAA